MSVEVSVEAELTGRYEVVCCDSDEVLATVSGDDRQAGELIAAVHRSECETCETYGATTLRPETDIPDEPSVQMSNSNAARVFDALGVEVGDELAGSANPATLLVATRQALAADRRHDGRAAEAYSLASGGTWVECGTDAFYLRRRFCEIADVAEAAAARGRKVIWC